MDIRRCQMFFVLGKYGIRLCHLLARMPIQSRLQQSPKQALVKACFVAIAQARFTIGSFARSSRQTIKMVGKNPQLSTDIRHVGVLLLCELWRADLSPNVQTKHPLFRLWMLGRLTGSCLASDPANAWNSCALEPQRKHQFPPLHKSLHAA